MYRNFTLPAAHNRESIVRWLELILDGTGWSPTRLAKEAAVIRPKNPEFMPHEVPVDSLEILGRVIGMWRRV